MQDPSRPDESQSAQVFQYTIIKYQMGVNAGIVYNVTPNLHFDLDFFRAEAGWYVVNGLPAAEAGRLGRQRRHDRQLVASSAAPTRRRAHHSACTPIDGSTMRKPTGCAG